MMEKTEGMAVEANRNIVWFMDDMGEKCHFVLTIIQSLLI